MNFAIWKKHLLYDCLDNDFITCTKSHKPMLHVSVGFNAVRKRGTTVWILAESGIQFLNHTNKVPSMLVPSAIALGKHLPCRRLSPQRRSEVDKIQPETLVSCWWITLRQYYPYAQVIFWEENEICKEIVTDLCARSVIVISSSRSRSSAAWAITFLLQGKDLRCRMSRARQNLLPISSSSWVPSCRPWWKKVRSFIAECTNCRCWEIVFFRRTSLSFLPPNWMRCLLAFDNTW